MNELDILRNENAEALSMLKEVDANPSLFGEDYAEGDIDRLHELVLKMEARRVLKTHQDHDCGLSLNPASLHHDPIPEVDAEIIPDDPEEV